MIKSKYPVVSVIVPCYNHENYIEQCILSIINQTYTNIELIVIDDGSTDRSFEILTQLRLKYIFFLETQENIGLSKTLNKAIIKYATGEYVCIIASDDYWDPFKIEKQIDIYLKKTYLGLLFAKSRIVDNYGSQIGEYPSKRISACSFDTLILGNYIAPLTVMIKKSVLEDVGLFDEESYIEDWDLWLRIIYKYPIYFIDEYVAFYRQHETNISKNYAKMIPAKKKILYKWEGYPLFAKAFDTVILEEIAILSILDKSSAIVLLTNQLRLFKYLSYWKSLIKLLIK